MRIYIVKRGETLAKIAKKYNVSLEQLRAVNQHIKNVEKLVPGMKVKVPTAEIRLKPKQVTPVSEQRENKTESSKNDRSASNSVESQNHSAVAAESGGTENDTRQMTPPPYPYTDDAPSAFPSYYYPSREWSGPVGSQVGFGGNMAPSDMGAPYMENTGMSPCAQPFASYPYAPYECHSCGGYAYPAPTYGHHLPEQPYPGTHYHPYEMSYPTPPHYPHPYSPQGHQAIGLMPEMPALPPYPSFDSVDRQDDESASV